MIRSIYRRALFLGGIVLLVIVSYYLNMPVDVRSIIAYLKIKKQLSIQNELTANVRT